MAEPHDDMTAAELALGVLDGDARTTAMRRILSDPSFARDVERWRDHFGMLFAQWPEEVPSERVAARITASLSPAPTPRRFWPAIAVAASATAAILAGILVLRPGQVAPPAVIPTATASPIFVASLVPAKGGAAAVLAVYDPARQEIQVAAADLAKSGRSAQLWLIPADGKPRSLGILVGRTRTAAKLPPELRALIGAKAALAVSDEPQGGSRTGMPTGAILASGSLIPV